MLENFSMIDFNKFAFLTEIRRLRTGSLKLSKIVEL